MSFGAMFAAVVFAVLCLGWGSRLLLPDGDSPHRLVTLLWGALGLALPLGLLLRRRWSRWAGLAAALLLAVVGARLVLDRGDILDHLVLLAGILTSILLAVPATGDLRPRAATEEEPQPRGLAQPLGWATFGLLASLACLCLPGVVASWAPAAQAGPAAPTAAGRAAPPSAGRATSRMPAAGLPSAASPSTGSGPDSAVSWSDFGAGARRAKSEGRPMLVDFYATWCGVCKRMDRQTFRDPDVVRRLATLVPVRVDSEETTTRDGFRGADLAERHGIRGYPTIVLFDSAGREISRFAGYLEPRPFLAWIDSSLRNQAASTQSAVNGLRAGR